MNHMPHLNVFLSGQRLHMQHIENDRWSLVDSKRQRLLDVAVETRGETPRIELFVDTSSSSTHFPQTPVAQARFDAEESDEWFEEAFDWLDDFIDTLHEDLGDYVCTITTGANDVRRFQAKGYAQMTDDSQHLTKTMSRAR